MVVMVVCMISCGGVGAVVAGSGGGCRGGVGGRSVEVVVGSCGCGASVGGM